MKTFLRMIMVVLMLLAMSATLVAQDDVIDDDYFADVDRIYYVDPDPVTVAELTTDDAIEAITDDSEAYYGTVVTVEAQLVNFISPNMFEMGEEDELLTNSFVLVVNNSNNPFPAGLIEGAIVRVTGRVHPSHDVVMDGYDWTYPPFDENLATMDATQQGEGRMNMVNFAQSGYIPGAFGEHTILEVLNVENVEILAYDDLLAVD